MKRTTKHLLEWIRVLYHERTLLKPKAILTIIKGTWWLATGHKVPDEVVYKRYRACLKCPIYDAGLRRCRQGTLGCGCYMPFKVLTNPEGGCWIKNVHWKMSNYFGWDEYKPVLSERDVAFFKKTIELEKRDMGRK